jgi:hypothetical protein
MVTQEITQGDRFGMVMIGAKLRLMGVPGIEGLALKDIGVTKPDMVPLPDPGAGIAIASCRMHIGKGIARIEDFHSVHAQANCPQRGQVRGGGDLWAAREGEDEMLIHRKVWKQTPVPGVVVPGPHHLAAQAGAENIDPVGGRINPLHAAIGWRRLREAAITPSGFAAAGQSIGVRPVNPGELAGVHGEPRCELGIGPDALSQSQKQLRGEPDESVLYHGMLI